LKLFQSNGHTETDEPITPSTEKQKRLLKSQSQTKQQNIKMAK